ncbi:unnamed protein product [Trifolium pratense]|uniref:Uncharacterized protein n=1 Tax=Trifolium pratense TaxID=57577 RepID=A0ACB0II41_TRIPR|nr:unnamed protein product [Trifolium pratense]
MVGYKKGEEKGTCFWVAVSVCFFSLPNLLERKKHKTNQAAPQILNSHFNFVSFSFVSFFTHHHHHLLQSSLRFIHHYSFTLIHQIQIEFINMDSDSSSPWNTPLSSSYNSTVTSSKSYLSALQSRSDMFMGGGFDENDVVVDDDDDVKEEFLCPFCSEYFDIVGLCCHIDEEHPVEAKNGVCPVCALRVGVDMVAHIALQHGSILKIQRKRKSRKGGSYSTLSLLRKELREGNLQSLLGGSSCIMSSSNAAPDPLLSSFILPVADDFSSSQSQPNFHTGTRQSRKSLDETLSKKEV